MTEDEYAALMTRRAKKAVDFANYWDSNPDPDLLKAQNELNERRSRAMSLLMVTKPVKVEMAQKERNHTAAPRQAKQPNKTEAEYGKLLGLEFPGALIVFEGLSFRMSNGHRYTPDWVVCQEDLLLCVEVKARGKNGFRHPSYQRARLAFDQCRHDYPAIQWRWAEKFRGAWDF